MRRLQVGAAIVAVSCFALPSMAQSQAASAAASPSTPAKKELAQKLVALQQPAIESMVRNLVEGPARQLMAAGEPVLQTRVAPEKREAAIKQVQDEVKQYVDGALPVVRERANKLAQSSLVPAFEEKFSEDELRQIVTFYESPVNKKLQQTMPDISSAMAKQLVAESRAQIDPKVKVLEANVAKALGVPLQAPAKPASSAAAPGQGLVGNQGGIKLGKPLSPAASRP